MVYSQSNQSKLCGHVVLTKLDTGKVSSHVFPRNVQDIPLHVLMTGPMTKAQILMVRKCLRVRRSVVRELLTWFTERHQLYKHLKNQPGLMSPGLDVLPVDDFIPSMFHHDPEEQTPPSKELGPQTGMAGQKADGDLTVVTTIGVNPTTSNTTAGVLNKAAGASDPTVAGLHVASSNKVVGGYLPFTLEKAFPAKFPFYRGGPSEDREIAVSMEEAIAHLTRLSHGAFQTTEFTLVAYDLSECIRANKSAFVSCLQKMPDGHTRGEHFAKMSPDELRLVAW